MGYAQDGVSAQTGLAESDIRETDAALEQLWAYVQRAFP